jgi:hypothetical protein
MPSVAANTEPKSPNSSPQSQNSLVKMLSIFACCGNLKLVWKSAPLRSSTVAPDDAGAFGISTVQAVERSTSGINRGNTRPKAIEIEEPWSRREESDTTHRYYCPICMYYFEEMYSTSCCHHNLCQDCYNDIAARTAQMSAGCFSSLSAGISLESFTNSDSILFYPQQKRRTRSMLHARTAMTPICASHASARCAPTHTRARILVRHLFLHLYRCSKCS